MSVFARGVATLIAGTAGAQLLGIAVMPILSRLYGPEDFGILAIFTAFMSMLLVVSGVRYELAIPLPKEDSDAVNIAALSLLLVVTTSGLTAIVIGLFGASVAHAVGAPLLESYLWMLPLAVLLAGSYSTITYWSVRKKDFTILARNKLWQAVTVVAIQLAGFKLGAASLLVGQVAGQSVGAGSLLHSFLRGPGAQGINLDRIAYVARAYCRFPVFSAPAGLVNAAGAKLPAIMLSALFSPHVAGYYLLSERLVFAPSAILQDAVSKVLFSKADTRGNSLSYTSLVEATHRRMLTLASPIGLFMAYYSEKMFTFVLGAQWAQAGLYAQALAIMFIFQFASSPLSVVLHSLHRPDLTLLCNTVLFALRIAGLIAGYIYGSAMASVVCFSVLSAIAYHIFSIVSVTTAGVSIGKVNINAGIALVRAILVIGPSVAILVLTSSESLAIAAGLAAMFIYYTAWIRRISATRSIL